MTSISETKKNKILYLIQAWIQSVPAVLNGNQLKVVQALIKFQQKNSTNIVQKMILHKMQMGNIMFATHAKCQSTIIMNQEDAKKRYWDC